MKIQDAIINAGEGGKGKHLKGNEFEIYGGQVMFKCPLTLAEASDCRWEVIAPDIEVGDVVKLSHSDKCEHEVLAEPESGYYCLEGYKRLLQKDELATHVLIRKGAKKKTYRAIKEITFEGDCTAKQTIPWHDDKTYTLEITEEAE